MVPSVQKVTRVFEMLFVDDPSAQSGELGARYDQQGSILDAVNEQAKAMNQRLSTRDQEKLDLQAVQTSQRTWLSLMQPIQRAFDTSITGMILGTTTLQKAVANIRNQYWPNLSIWASRC